MMIITVMIMKINGFSDEEEGNGTYTVLTMKHGQHAKFALLNANF